MKAAAMRSRRTVGAIFSIVFAASAALMSWSTRANSQVIQSAPEQSIKAAYLYQFAAYVQWPESAFSDVSTPLTIGVFGAASLTDELRRITADRTVNGRSIRVRNVGEQDSLKGLHVLFAATADAGELSRLTTDAMAHSVLVVTEAGNALELGSVINFRPVDHRIRFEVSLDAADRNQLRLSSRLLAVAEHVQPRGSR